MRKWLSILAVLSVVLAACGGSGDAGDAEDVTTTAAGPSDGGDEETPATTAAADEPGDASGDEDGDEPADGGSASTPVDGLGTATVTIDGEAYVFGDAGIASQCMPDSFGVFMVALYLVGDDGAPDLGAGSLSLFLLQEGSDPEELDQRPEAIVTLGGTSQSWVASERKAEEFELEPGISQIDSYTIDGNTATGTATFFEENSYFAFAGGGADEIQTATGTFEVTCAEE